MSSRPSISQLEQLKVIMTQMLAEAKDGNWQELSRLDSERRVVLDYSDNRASKTAAPLAAPAVSSSYGPLALAGCAYRRSPAKAFKEEQLTADKHQREVFSEQYCALSRQLMELDAEIKTTVESARKALLTQSRGMRAQVIAKKGYETTQKIKASSYS